MSEKTLKQILQRKLTIGATWLLAAAVLAGCPRNEVDRCSGADPHPECPRCLGDNPDPECPTVDAGPTDMSTTDAGTDIGPDTSAADMPPDVTEPDLGPCGGCEAPLLCNELSGECVSCLDTVDCTDGVCDTATGECVGCLTNADCPEATASLCDTATNTCTSCAVNDDCSHVPDATVCLTETCVQCTDTTDGRDACNGNSCDPATNLCTNTSTESANVCETCVADSECMPDHLCVPMDFNGTFHGNYCLKVFGACERPYGQQIVDRMTMNGQTESFCGIAENQATCAAVLAFGADCSTNGASDCAVDGALCETVAGIANSCTYACDDSLQCPPSRVCNNGYCGG